MTDWELLNRYVSEGSGEAMGELAGRHVDMVYGAALRAVRDPGMAEDVTQSVFMVLMRRAKTISPRVVIGGWLFQVTRYAAADARKKRERRMRHETEAGKMRLDEKRGEERGELAAVLEEMIGELPREDRDGLVLKYLEGRGYEEVAAALGTSEEAARKRVSRAVAKLRAKLAKRGITGADEVGTALSGWVVMAAPGKVLTQIQALASGTSGSAASVSITNEVIKMMRMQRIKLIGGMTVAALVLAVGASVVLMKVGGVSAEVAVATGGATTEPAKTAETPKDVVQRAYSLALKGDEDKFVACFDSLTPAQETAMRSFVKAASAGNMVMEAVGKQFGEAAKNTLSQQAMGATSDDVTGATETVDGDTAMVDIGNSGPGKVAMVKVNGEWKISNEALKTFDPTVSTMLAARAEQLKKFAGDVAAGNYASVAEVRRALMKMMRSPAATP